MPETETKRGPSCLGVFAFLFLFFVLWGILFPARWGLTENAQRVQAKNYVMGLITAVKAFQTEYGMLPLRQIAQFEDEATQARLLRVLQALDNDLNPKRILFFEANPARKRWWNAQYTAGLHPVSGALIDPWGNPYRVRVATAESGNVESPYLDGVAEEIRSPVIAWSLGRDGVQGSPGKENILQDSDDVVSWR